MKKLFFVFALLVMAACEKEDKDGTILPTPPQNNPTVSVD